MGAGRCEQVTRSAGFDRRLPSDRCLGAAGEAVGGCREGEGVKGKRMVQKVSLVAQHEQLNAAVQQCNEAEPLATATAGRQVGRRRCGGDGSRGRVEIVVEALITVGGPCEINHLLLRPRR